MIICAVKHAFPLVIYLLVANRLHELFEEWDLSASALKHLARQTNESIQLLNENT